MFTLNFKYTAPFVCLMLYFQTRQGADWRRRAKRLKWAENEISLGPALGVASRAAAAAPPGPSNIINKRRRYNVAVYVYK